MLNGFYKEMSREEFLEGVKVSQSLSYKYEKVNMAEKNWKKDGIIGKNGFDRIIR